MSVKRKTASKRTPTTARLAPARNEVEIDEPRQRAGDTREAAFQLETSEGPDALAEELGEEFCENVTGANDAASEHRDQETLDEQGAFLITGGEAELAEEIDASNLPDNVPAPRQSV